MAAMLGFLSRRAKWIIAGFAVLMFFLTQTAWFKGMLQVQQIEASSVGQRYRWRPTGEARPEIKIIGVEASSLSLDSLSEEEISASPVLPLMREPWPWKRAVWSALLDKLFAAGAKVVAFDIVFASAMEGDEEFAAALKKYENKVVVASIFLNAKTGEKQKDQSLVEPSQSLVEPGSNIVGFGNVSYEPNGSVQRGRYRTSAMKEYYFGNWDGPDDLISLSALTVEKFNGSVKTPAYDHSNFINFAGGRGRYEVVPVEQIFVDSIWKKSRQTQNGAAFKDKIVLVGAFAEILHDTHDTPFGIMSGPEIQANMIATLLDNSSLNEPSDRFNVISTALMIFLIAAICIFFQSATLKSFAVVGLGAAFVGISQLYFNTSGLVIKMVPPLFGLVTTGVFGIGVRYWMEQVERARVKNVLEKYVSKNVAKTILNDSRSFVDSFRGKKQPVTVLFSDIRGFTSMTEGSDAAKLVAQLNEYFLEMVGIVLTQGGTLQKFIGDAIMAVWGDTHSHGFDVDARAAVQGALQMRAALAKLNEKWTIQPDRAKLAIGVGINHGEVIVGNIGHPQRMEFTVLGDGVNLAARLESATKQFKTDILVGEEAEKLTRDHFIFRNVGAIAFKGKTKPIEVYFVLSDRSQPAPAWLEEYHEAVALYRRRCFEQAAEKFKTVQDKLGGDDYLCHMYLERCAACLQMTLPQTWDGSFALTEK